MRGPRMRVIHTKPAISYSIVRDARSRACAANPLSLPLRVSVNHKPRMRGRHLLPAYACQHGTQAHAAISESACNAVYTAIRSIPYPGV
ncbi:hypothetical protein FKM82_019381 [Ascaphus truei]